MAYLFGGDLPKIAIYNAEMKRRVDTTKNFYKTKVREKTQLAKENNTKFLESENLKEEYKRDLKRAYNYIGITSNYIIDTKQDSNSRRFFVNTFPVAKDILTKLRVDPSAVDKVNNNFLLDDKNKIKVGTHTMPGFLSNGTSFAINPYAYNDPQKRDKSVPINGNNIPAFNMNLLK